MDREIPKEIRQKERNKKIIRYSSIGVASIVVIGVLISVLRACLLYTSDAADD